MSRTPIQGTPIHVGGEAGAVTGEHDAAGYSSPPVTDHDRIVVLESGVVEIKRRLRDGAASFGDIRTAFERVTTVWSKELERVEADLKVAIREAKPAPIPKVALWAPLIFVGGLIWWASRYPQRDEFERLRELANDNHNEIRLLHRDIEALKPTKGPTP